jgi:hypothetical protein
MKTPVEYWLDRPSGTAWNRVNHPAASMTITSTGGDAPHMPALGMMAAWL